MSHLHHYQLKAATILRFLLEGLHFYFQLLTHPGKTPSLNRFERRIYSQNGEDGLLLYIFKKISPTNHFFVELGAGDGQECNTRYLKRLGWTGLQIDAQTTPGIKAHFLTTENIVPLFKKYRVPRTFDLLSIDLDGNDYWLWRALKNYHPRVVIIEYNASLPYQQDLTIPYDPNFNWDGTTFFGASLGALVKLGRTLGYQLVATNKTGANAFFVTQELARQHFKPSTLKALYHPPLYGQPKSGRYLGHPPSPRLDQLTRV